MNKNLTIILAIVVAVAIVSVVVYASVTFTNTANVLVSGEVTYMLDGNPWSNGPISWGDISAGTSISLPLNVVNDKNVAVTPTLVSTPPTGVTLTWTLNNTPVAAKSQATRTLTLTVASDVPPGAITFEATINP